MANYWGSDVQNWITQVEEQSVRVAERIIQAVQRDVRLQRIIADEKEGRDRLFAALLTNDLSYLRTDEFVPDWVSWVEGEAPYQLLYEHQRVLVDLVSDVSTVSEFTERYGCSPAQMAALVKRYPDNIYINIRDDNFSNYTNNDGKTHIFGQILEVWEDHPAIFYRLPPLVKAGLSILVPHYSDFAEQADTFAKEYDLFYAERLKDWNDDGSFNLRSVARNGAWLHPNAFRGRLKYYLAARSLWTGRGDTGSAADEHLDEWLASDPQPKFHRLGDLRHLRDMFSRLATSHNLYTAKLTGSLGGNYSMLPHEIDQAQQQRSTLSASKAAVVNVPYTTFLFGLSLGRAKLSGTKLVREQARAPSPLEWRRFLDTFPETRMRIRYSYSDVTNAIQDAAFKMSANRTSPLEPSRNLEDLVEVLNRVIFKSSNPRILAETIIGGSAAVLGGAVFNQNWALGSLITLAPFVLLAMKYNPALAPHCERLESMLDWSEPYRMHKVTIVNALQPSFY